MIRPFLLSDHAALIEIFHRNTPVWFHVSELADLENYLMKHSHQNYFVAELNDKVICSGGFFFMNETKSEGRLAWLMIDPAYHGKGVGRKIVEHCLILIRKEKSVKIISVRTSQLTDKFYARFGFKTIATKKDYWAPGMDLVHMEMEV